MYVTEQRLTEKKAEAFIEELVRQYDPHFMKKDISALANGTIKKAWNVLQKDLSSNVSSIIKDLVKNDISYYLERIQVLDSGTFDEKFHFEFYLSIKESDKFFSINKVNEAIEKKTIQKPPVIEMYELKNQLEQEKNPDKTKITVLEKKIFAYKSVLTQIGKLDFIKRLIRYGSYDYVTEEDIEFMREQVRKIPGNEVAEIINVQYNKKNKKPYLTIVDITKPKNHSDQFLFYEIKFKSRPNRDDNDYQTVYGEDRNNKYMPLMKIFMTPKKQDNFYNIKVSRSIFNIGCLPDGVAQKIEEEYKLRERRMF